MRNLSFGFHVGMVTRPSFERFRVRLAIHDAGRSVIGIGFEISSQNVLGGTVIFQLSTVPTKNSKESKANNTHTTLYSVHHPSLSVTVFDP